MSRALWKGAISFGLVNIPIELHTAVRDNRPRFRMLHASDKSPIKFQRVCARDGTPVAWEDLVKGYEYEKGRFVVLTKEDFQAAALEKSRTVDILDFVKTEEIDERFFETPYYMLPAKGGERAYALLREAIRASDRIGIAKIILRETQHLAALQVIGSALVLTMMRFADELADISDVQLPRRRRRPSAGARDGQGPGREPRRGVGPGQIHRRLPREPDEGDPRQIEGPGADASHAGGAAVGRSRRPRWSACAEASKALAGRRGRRPARRRRRASEGPGRRARRRSARRSS